MRGISAPAHGAYAAPGALDSSGLTRPCRIGGQRRGASTRPHSDTRSTPGAAPRDNSPDVAGRTHGRSDPSLRRALQREDPRSRGALARNGFIRSKGCPSVYPVAGGHHHGPVPARWAWHDRAVHDYLVAAHPPGYRIVSPAPDGKRHAYLPGARTTACGFELNAMQRFADLRFSAQAPAMRCPLCARAVGADH